jgi:hypothetical protein
MTRGEDQARQLQQVIEHTRRVRSETEDTQARTVEAAEEVAATEEDLAGTMERMAKNQPHRAEHLRTLGESARKQAARERQWAKDHDPDARHRD